MTNLLILNLGRQPYKVIYEAMQHYTQNRQSQDVDKILLLEHHPVFTQGQSLQKSAPDGNIDIPTVTTDRGGQITYHGPGQLILYPLLNLKDFSLSS